MYYANMTTSNPHHTLDTLLDCARLLERRLNTQLSNTRGISHSEYRILRCIRDDHGGEVTRVDLAAGVGLTPSAITRALMPLEKLGYIATQKSDRDARRSLATLTPAGKELLADAQTAVDDVVRLLPLNTLDGSALNDFYQELLVPPRPSRS